ncbi:uncharacterized protein LOC131670313 [Phymastichus coffea]|uniref:uncharacterized protein LOC131670313 n=1 Tax=Phymastichus coffea TaxID=108790 RepID=UPI00273BECB8|nr:uncharacterized protein LOC131670313 [Phymastichus coffea]
MISMLRLELVGLVLLTCNQILTEHRDFYGLRNQYGSNHRSSGNYAGAKTREIHTTCGRLKGTVVQPYTDSPLVDVFLGVPYADPPTSNLRFEPPRSPSPKSWAGVRHCTSFQPVCPQLLPDIEEEVEGARRRYLEKLMIYLDKQNEDCLYLNIYAPHQNASQRNSLERYPVIVFIHGESYEWNSGNPYDGSVLAAYGNVVFVSLNFRLGILGFLRPGTKDNTPSNFGLWDQIAALDWLKQNIGHFGGDPERITLLGHGTGAVFAHLLMLFPKVTDDYAKRAILMSGSALNPDAIGKAPLQITKQVAHALNCNQSSEEALSVCLKNARLQDLLAVKIDKPKYVPAFAPLVGSSIISDKPSNLMKSGERLSKFGLLYGVTELEKFHLLPGVALLQGMSDSERDDFIRDSIKATHELDSDVILNRVLQHYEASYDLRERNRDIALEVVSDSGVVAPMLATANLHSRVNNQSYMYVFTHPRRIREKSEPELDEHIRRTVYGEELPYVLGVPLGGEGHHLSGPYDRAEVLLSKAMMDWWCNFAYSGDPNKVRPAPRQRNFHRQHHLRDESSPYSMHWPRYDPVDQTYFNLMTPPQIGQRYRTEEMEFWNIAIPDLLRRPREPDSVPPTSQPLPHQITQASTSSFQWHLYNQTISRPSNVVSPTPSLSPEDKRPDKDKRKSDETNNGNSGGTGDSGGGGGGVRSAVSLVVGFGVVFLLINTTVLVYLYRKRAKMRKKAAAAIARPAKPSGESCRELGYCSASKPDIRDLIKSDKAYDNNSNFGRRSRENSISTIDTRIKVREWIQQEIVHRCSPRFLRKTRETLQREHREKLMKQQLRRLETCHSDEERRLRLEESMYEESQQIRVRPGVKRHPANKVSVAVDATPATRTNSVLNQIPVELTRTAGPSTEYLDAFEDTAAALGLSEYCEPIEFQPDDVHKDETRGGPNIVVIEHHHSRSDPSPMGKFATYGTGTGVSPPPPRNNESDSGSTSSLYAKINPKKKSRLPASHHIQRGQIQREILHEQEPTSEHDLPANELNPPPGEPFASATLPRRMLTFGSPAALAPLQPPAACLDVNVTSRDSNAETTTSDASTSHEEALRTIRRRNYPKVLPDIEKRRSLPPNAAFAIGRSQSTVLRHPQPPSPPPRMCGTSRSLDCVEDKDEDEENNDGDNNLLPVKTNLHVGPLRKKIDSSKNQSVPSLVDTTDNTIKLVSSSSLSMCPIHGAFRQVIVPIEKNESRIPVSPRAKVKLEHQVKREDPIPRGVDQPDYPTRLIPERATKLPRIIIKPTTTGTLPRARPTAATPTSNLHDNETYQRLLARREKMLLPGELLPPTRIPMLRAEVVQRVNVPDDAVVAAVTKL